MKVKFLEESIKLQTKENLRKLENLLKCGSLSLQFFELGVLTDGKPGLFFEFGKDENFSKLLILTGTDKVL